jgi:hypothetical protein
MLEEAAAPGGVTRRGLSTLGMGQVESIGEFGLGPAAGAEEFFDHCVKASADGFFEQGEVFAGAFSDADAFAGFDPFLQCEEMAS